jgi:hypothetical protein
MLFADSRRSLSVLKWMVVKWRYEARIPVPAGDLVTIILYRHGDDLGWHGPGYSLEDPQISLGEALQGR